jgi:hypothetical protein
LMSGRMTSSLFGLSLTRGLSPLILVKFRKQDLGRGKTTTAFSHQPVPTDG